MLQLISAGGSRHKGTKVKGMVCRARYQTGEDVRGVGNERVWCVCVVKADRIKMQNRKRTVDREKRGGEADLCLRNVSEIILEQSQAELLLGINRWGF